MYLTVWHRPWETTAQSVVADNTEVGWLLEIDQAGVCSIRMFWFWFAY